MCAQLLDATVSSAPAPGSESYAYVEAPRMAIYWHPACVDHDIPDHPEQPDRVTVMLKHLRERFDDDEFVFFKEASRAKDEHILLFHTTHLLDHFNKLSDEAETYLKIMCIDQDTSVMESTREAAYHAVGSMVDAVDHLFAKKVHTAFCCVRPPGHHAETNKSMGFCFLNSAAIGARYAQQRHRVGKVAVIDFDVHHGNGTEEGFSGDPSLFYGSTHEIDNFPGTGRDPSPHVGDRAKKEEHRRIVNRTLERGPVSRPQFRRKWQEVLDEMVRFAPELVIISAGFDAHDEDPLACCELLEEDYAWATEAVFDACLRVNAARPPPVLSILEGGYDLQAISTSAVAHCEVLQKRCMKHLHGSSSDAALSADASKDVGDTADDDGGNENGGAKHGGDEVAALAEFLQELGF